MQNDRKPGLDLIRVLSALLVIICHSGVYFSIGFSVNFVSFAGLIAVEFFFVMSGFLVGKSLIQAATSPSPGSALKQFTVNRLFRILPLYYFSLVLTALISGKTIPLSCFVFLQNFRANDLGFLAQSWTLSVEAWFYFLVAPLFVLVVWLLSRKLSEKASVVVAITLLCLTPFTLRILAANASTPPQWDEDIRKQVLLRLDSIGIGVALAAIKKYHTERYIKVFKSPVGLLLSLSGIWVLYQFYCGYLVVDDHFDSSALCKIFVFSILPLLSSLTIAFMDCTDWLDFLKAFLPLRWLSDLSYGVYLLHAAVFSLVCVYFVDARFSVSWLGFLGAIALTNVLSAVTYLLIEKPMTKLRDKLLRKHIPS